MKTESYKSNLIFLFLLFLIILFLRLVLNIYLELPLHFDEAQYWDWSRNLEWGYFSKPPVLPGLIRSITNICGNSENCIRSASPIFHFLTSIVIAYSTFCITKSHKKAIFGGLLFNLMPGITFSSLMISTDVPLLFFSSLVGLLVIKLYKLEQKNNLYYFLLTIVLALGILSKYATLYLLISIFISVILLKDIRILFLNKKFLFSILGVMLLILPHIIWNINNGFVTFTHTAANANFKGLNFNLFQGIIFLISQALIFGFIPVYLIIKRSFLFVSLSTIQQFAFLNFIIPIIIILFLSITSRANANWAVIGYPFGCLFLASLIKTNIPIYKSLSLLNQFFFSSFLVFFLCYQITEKIDPFYKLRHVKPLANILKYEITSRNNIAFISDDREDFAHMLYYLKDLDIKKAKWNGDSRIDDHYELTTDINDLRGKDVLLLTRTSPTQEMIDRSVSYKKIRNMRLSYLNKERVFNIFLMKSWN